MRVARTSFAIILFATASVAITAPTEGWAAAGQTASTARLLGTVTAGSGDTITLKSDAGVVATITVSDTTRLVRTAPGQKDLTGATVIHVQDLAEAHLVADDPNVWREAGCIEQEGDILLFYGGRDRVHGEGKQPGRPANCQGRGATPELPRCSIERSSEDHV